MDILAARFAAREIAEDMNVAYWRESDGADASHQTTHARKCMAELAAAMGYTLAPIAVDEVAA